MNKILEKINEIKKENPDLRVYLWASKNREKFYEKFGFIKRIDAELGYGMILKGWKTKLNWLIRNEFEKEEKSFHKTLINCEKTVYISIYSNYWKYLVFIIKVFHF